MLAAAPLPLADLLDDAAELAEGNLARLVDVELGDEALDTCLLLEQA